MVEVKIYGVRSSELWKVCGWKVCLLVSVDGMSLWSMDGRKECIYMLIIRMN